VRRRAGFLTLVTTPTVRVAHREMIIDGEAIARCAPTLTSKAAA